ncbi:hypothetical protein D3C85_1587300 [compost metagenome]
MRPGAIDHEQAAFRITRQTFGAQQAPGNVDRSRYMPAFERQRATNIHQNEIDFASLLAAVDVGTIGFEGQTVAEMHQGDGRGGGGNFANQAGHGLYSK